MKLTGYTAIEFAEAHELTLSKYTDPTEESREGLSPAEARKVAAEDPSLIYLDTDLNAAKSLSSQSPAI